MSGPNVMMKPLAPLPDRRRMIRTHVPGPLRWKRARDGSEGRGELRTLSAGGVSFVTAAAIAVDDELSVEIRGGRTNAPSLEARMQVLRVEAAPEGRCVAGRFIEQVKDPAS